MIPEKIPPIAKTEEELQDLLGSIKDPEKRKKEEKRLRADLEEYKRWQKEDLPKLLGSGIIP